MTPGQETPVVGPKKITIHVGGSRSSTAASPAPQIGQSGDLGRPGGATDGNRNVPPPLTNTTAASFQVDPARALPGVAPSPRSSTAGPMPGIGGPQIPGGFPRPNGNVPGAVGAPNGTPVAIHHFQQPPPAHQLQNGHPAPAPLVAPPIYDYKYRAPGRGMFTATLDLLVFAHARVLLTPIGYADSLLPSVLIRTHPSVAMDHRFRLEIPADAKEAHQNLTVHVPGNHGRLQVIPRLAPFEHQGRAYRMFVSINGQTVGRATPLPVPDDPLPQNAIVFDLNLQYTTNIVIITVIAALPKGQKLPNGADCEVERLVLNCQLLRAY